MNWGNKVKVKTTIVYPKAPPFIQRTIKDLPKPIDLNKLLEHPSIEWEEESKKPITLRTKVGVIWIKSKNCIQISHVEKPDIMDKLEEFIYQIIYKQEKRSFWEWLKEKAKEEWDAWEEMWGLKE